MLRKLAILVMLAFASIGVLGRSVSKEVSEETFEDVFPTAYCDRDNEPQVKASLSTFDQCMKNIYTKETNIMNITKAYFTNDFGLIFKTFCASSLLVKTCSRPMFRSLTSCVSASALQSSQERFDRMIDLLCENEGAKMTLFHTKGTECKTQQQLDLDICDAAKVSTVQGLIGVYGSGPAVPDNEICNVELSESKCEAEALKQCSNSELGTLVEELNNRLFVSGCDEETTYLTTPVTVASGTTLTVKVPSQGGLTGMVQLNKKMLELIVRRYEIDTWARENELKIQHTDLTSDIEKVQL